MLAALPFVDVAVNNVDSSGLLVIPGVEPDVLVGNEALEVETTFSLLLRLVVELSHRVDRDNVLNDVVLRLYCEEEAALVETERIVDESLMPKP